MKALIRYAIAAILISTNFHYKIYSQSSVRGNYPYPSPGSFQLTLSTGVPYLGVAEVGYVFSKRFTASGIIGRTPNIMGYGVKLQAILYQPNNFYRVYFRSPIFYYPKTKKFGDEPWVLTWPVIASEWTLNSNSRFSLGLGFVEAHCIDSMFKGKNHHDDGETHHMMEFEGGFWNTIHAGLAWPIRHDIMMQTEFSLVMDGLKIAGEEYIGGPPIIAFLSITKSF